jgi:hypothetical protein
MPSSLDGRRHFQTEFHVGASFGEKRCPSIMPPRSMLLFVGCRLGTLQCRNSDDRSDEDSDLL